MFLAAGLAVRRYVLICAILCECARFELKRELLHAV
jgi:hypothetical protein